MGNDQTRRQPIIRWDGNKGPAAARLANFTRQVKCARVRQSAELAGYDIIYTIYHEEGALSTATCPGCAHFGLYFRDCAAPVMVRVKGRRWDGQCGLWHRRHPRGLNAQMMYRMPGGSVRGRRLRLVCLVLCLSCACTPPLALMPPITVFVHL